MSTEIFYFSGTGNSLHAAKELQKRIPGAKLIPMVSLLNQDIIETTGETVGLVFPLHLTTVPIPVKEFLNRVNLQSAKYIFGLTTRAGFVSVADIYIDKKLKKQGKGLDAFFILNMADNSPTGLKPGPGNKNWISHLTKGKIAQLESEVQSRLDWIQKAVNNQEKIPTKNARNPLFNLLECLISALTKNANTRLNFYTDTTCTGCGICEKVCPSHKIKINGGKPGWQEDFKCYYCYACFNFCPAQSILLKNYTDKNGRYFHPEITASDIAGQK